jgi:hypothetical protein
VSGSEVEPAETDPSDAPGKLQVAVGAIALIALLAAVVLLAIAMLPGHVQHESNPSSLSLVIANRWVIWLARLCGLAIVVMFVFFSIYVIRSIAHRMRHGHWLQRGGPFQAEIADRAGDALADVEPLFDALNQAEARNQELESQLTESNHLIEQLANFLEQAVAAGFEIPGARDHDDQET